MESVCSQVVPGSSSSCKWESLGTENGSVTDVLKLRLFQDPAVPISGSR